MIKKQKDGDDAKKETKSDKPSKTESKVLEPPPTAEQAKSKKNEIKEEVEIVKQEKQTVSKRKVNSE